MPLIPPDLIKIETYWNVNTVDTDFYIYGAFELK